MQPTDQYEYTLADLRADLRSLSDDELWPDDRSHDENVGDCIESLDDTYQIRPTDAQIRAAIVNEICSRAAFATRPVE